MTNAADGSSAPVDIDWARLQALHDEQEILIVFESSMGSSWETVNAISKVQGR